MSTKTLLTVEQFAQLHDPSTEDFELVEGELSPLPSGLPRHARTRGRVERRLGNYFERTPIGAVYAELDCRTGEGTVRRPDVSVFLTPRLSRIDDSRIPVPFAPDIAIEVLSPSESAIEVHRRVRDYLDAGCLEVWLLDASNAVILIHTPSEIRRLFRDSVLETPLLPGFTAPVADLLALP
jgi:Uma2 family endonuclease